VGGYHGGKTLKERFDEKWEHGPNGCWNWRFANPLGRANTFSLNGHIMRAYRAGFIIYRGPIPEGRIVCHACDNPMCVNPDHLWLGSHADNRNDALAKQRDNTARGEQMPSAKLTEDDVRTIRATVGKRGTVRAAARHYGVTHSSIQDIIKGKTWRHVS
jgi:hypothetical protein